MRISDWSSDVCSSDLVHVELQRVDEPQAELAEGKAVAHRHGPGADEALPAGAEHQAFDRAAGGIGAVEDPDGLAVLRRRFEDVTQRRDEGVEYRKRGGGGKMG